MKVIDEWAFQDPGGVPSWVSTFPEGPLRDKAVDKAVFWGQGPASGAVAEMLDAIGNADLTAKYGESLGSLWLIRDPAAARLWIQNSTLPDTVKQTLLAPK